MRFSRCLILPLAIAVGLTGTAAASAKTLHVVATFTILADMVA